MLYRTLFALLGLAIFAAVFAGMVYADDTKLVTRQPAFNLDAGELRADFLEPSVPGGEISVNITVTGAPIDIWFMDQEWLASTITPGTVGFNLTKPFSYHAQWTRFNVTGTYEVTLIADGHTRIAMVLDHADVYYDDTVPEDRPAHVVVQTRYLTEESRSLWLGYLAALPSVVLIGLTLARKIQRVRRARRDRGT